MAAADNAGEPSTAVPDSAPAATAPVYKDPDDGRQRFLLELEFVQCLANPAYIHYLAQNRYFEDEAFIGYLKYLRYWQRPEYIKFIMYPHCLFFLELLQNSNFRTAMAHPGNKELAHRQQYFFWKHYRNNRMKHIIPRPPPEAALLAPASTRGGAPTPAAVPATVPVTAPVLIAAPPPSHASPPVPIQASSISTPNMSAIGGTTLSPMQSMQSMQFAGTPGVSVSKLDMRNQMVDRRKRKKEGCNPWQPHVSLVVDYRKYAGSEGKLVQPHVVDQTGSWSSNGNPQLAPQIQKFLLLNYLGL